MDRQTMKDLEIFYSEGDGKSLFEMLNHTYTSGGENALRRRFLHPFCDKENIEETQKIVQYFLTQLGSWQMHIKENDVRFAEKYMASGIVIFNVSSGLAGWLTAKRFQRAQPDYFHFLKSGIINLINLLMHLDLFLKAGHRQEKPAFLAALTENTEGLLKHIFLENIHINNGLKMPATATLKADRLIRNEYRKEIESILKDFYEMDALFSMAISCKKYGLNFPVISETENISIQKMRHLFLENAVSNSFDAENKNFVFLTGANMSGKTTFLKAFCQLVFLSRLGMGIPAESAVLPVFDDIFSSINMEDDLRKKQSYFLSEVLRLKEMAALLHAGKRLFVVIDEMFRGTNLKDAINCSEIIIKKLLEWKNCFFILSSHIVELAGMLPAEKICFRCFETWVQNGRPVFSYKSKNGISSEHLGVFILKQTGIPALLDLKIKKN